MAEGTATMPLAQLYPLQEAGRPGLLEQQLQEDVASGQCMQVSAWAASGGH